MKIYHLAFIFGVVLAAGCGSDGDGRNNQVPSGDEAYNPPPAHEGSGTPSNASSQTCDGGGDCDYWYCQCEDGFVVNSRNCTNGYCLTAAGACPGACEHFNHGAWTGQYGGGPQTPTDPGPSNDCGGFASSSCGTCQETYCCSEGAACGGNTACLDYWDCAVACGGNGSCRDGCDELYPAGRTRYEALESCLASECTDECGF